MIELPPACVVRSLDEAKRVVATGLPATLLSARGAASFAGPLLWRRLADAARAAAPNDAGVHDVLDCLDAPGRAMEALRLGQRVLILDPSCPLYADVCRRAASLGASVLPFRPAAFEFRRRRDEIARLTAWLGGRGIMPSRDALDLPGPAAPDPTT